MSALETLREYVATHRWGLLTDLAFAVVWVTMVTVLFDLVDGPWWAYYLFMLAGVVAYYGLFGLEPVESENESES